MRADDQFDVMAQYDDGMNLYQYVQSRPQVGLDPTGLAFYVVGQDFDSTGPNGETDVGRCCTAACGCDHVGIFSAEDGALYDGWGGGYPPGIGGGIPQGPGVSLTKLRRCNSFIYPTPNGGGTIHKEMLWGPKKNCRDATNADIAACLRAKPKPSGDPGAFANCQTDVEEAASGCCLCGYRGLAVRPPSVGIGF